MQAASCVTCNCTWTPHPPFQGWLTDCFACDFRLLTLSPAPLSWPRTVFNQLDLYAKEYLDPSFRGCLFQSCQEQGSSLTESQPPNNVSQSNAIAQHRKPYERSYLEMCRTSCLTVAVPCVNSCWFDEGQRTSRHGMEKHRAVVKTWRPCFWTRFYVAL